MVPECRSVSSLGPNREGSGWKPKSGEGICLVKWDDGRWGPTEQRPGGQTMCVLARAGQLATSVAEIMSEHPEELAPKTGPGIQNLLCLVLPPLGGFLNL